ncbi:hypothetical protein PHA51_11575 [Rodentibacter pneumotropicus]|uniref:hypothetical protein n=1 Tax=Rodentibacter pneumotropicus TaxID=758 RepID=UPI00232B1758|nr:hypothetical protein [Rodentibacter pneumotropicus]MDC2826649.1 hypothetical protein [Rodentibacter pneumotropicus]
MRKANIAKAGLLAIGLSFTLSGCAELQKLANNLNLSGSTLPPYEFYAKFAETDNADVVLPLFRKNLTTTVNENGQQQVFKFPLSLVNGSTFLHYDDFQDDPYRFTNLVHPDEKIVNNKVKEISVSFSAVLNFTRSNFYKIFNLNPNDVKIIQLKQWCSSYRRSVPFYQITVRNGKSLYIIEESGSGIYDSQTHISFFRKIPSCKSLGYDKTIKQYGNESFDK